MRQEAWACWARECASAVAMIVGAHALAYFLVNILPDAASIALGLESAKVEVLSRYRSEIARRSYIEALSGIVWLDLGRTIDSVPVSSELGRALTLSAPRLALAFGLVCTAAVAVAFARRIPRRLVSFLSFLPPYVSAFFVLLILLVLGAAHQGNATLGIACALAIALSPGMLIAEQTASITARNLGSDFSRTLIAAGATDRFLRTRLLGNLFAELAPSLEKVLVLLAAGLLFAEPILGLPGLGTTTVRALRRSDPDLVLGATLVFAVGVCIARLAAVAIRRRFALST